MSGTRDILYGFGVIFLLTFAACEGEEPTAVTEEAEQTLQATLVEKNGHGERSNELRCIGAEELDAEQLADGWKNPMILDRDQECSEGGCVYGLRSAGSDEKFNTREDIFFHFLTGDCSSEKMERATMQRLRIREGSKLDYAQLRDARLQGLSAIDANLEGVVLDGALLTCWRAHYCTNFFGANLSGASLVEARASGVRFVGADLSGADLSESDLADADMKAIDGRKAIFEDADLNGVDFSEADLREANFYNAQLEGIIADDARWKGAICPNGERVGGAEEGKRVRSHPCKR